MNQPAKYFVFNKDKDYMKGFRDNISVDQKKILIEKNEQKLGVFFSHVMDSGERDTEWYRFTVNSDVFANTIVKITFYCDNSHYVFCNSKPYDINSIVHDTGISTEKKSELFSEFENETFINPTDVLFKKIKGRYLWFSVSLLTEQTRSPVVEKIKIFIKSTTWIQFLPEIMQTTDSSFTERYLAIFQNLYDSMTEQIRKSSSKLEINSADRDMMEWIASWTGLKNTDLWDDEQLRYILKNIVRIHKATGTAEIISEMIRLYTGKQPMIKENCDVYRQLNDNRIKKLYTDLYTDSMYTFSVLIRNEDLRSDDDNNAVIRIIEQYKPVHMKANLVILKPFILLDKYSYLGVNSVLGKYTTAALDGKSGLSFVIIGN